jgi:hypothetical protein
VAICRHISGNSPFFLSKSSVNIYGFQRIQHGPNKHGYAHQNLIQGYPEFCSSVKRVSTPEGKQAAAAIAAMDRRQLPGNIQQQHPSLLVSNNSNNMMPINRKRNKMEMSNGEKNGSSSNLSALSGLSGLSGLSSSLFKQHQHGGSTGSLGSLGSLGMSGPEANISMPKANETCQLNAAPVPPASSGDSLSGLSALLQNNNSANAPSTSSVNSLSGLSAILQSNNSANSLGLNSLGSLGMASSSQHYQQQDVGTTKQNEPFQLPDDMSSFGNKSFYSLQQNMRRDNNGSAFSLLSNLSAGNRSVGSVGSLRMNGSQLNFFKDLFQTSDLEGDIPMLSPSTGQSINATKQNAVFDTRHPMLVPSGAPTYVSSNGFLEKKPGLLEPSTDELLGLVSEDATPSTTTTAPSTFNAVHVPRTIATKNEDLNRSESVFPTKLHRVLQDSKREGFEHIVSWIHGGTAFKVHDVNHFMERIMPIYFDQSKFESFRRQLNLYGFTRVTRGPSRGMYYHQDFVQNDVSLCENITRPKNVRKRRKQEPEQAPLMVAAL